MEWILPLIAGLRIVRIERRREIRASDSEYQSKRKPIPAFKSEAEERKFWETHDSTDYVDWSTAQRVRFPNLKPSTTAISLRLPVSLLEQIREHHLATTIFQLIENALLGRRRLF